MSRWATTNRGEITASNSAGAGVSAREAALAGYLEWLEGRPLATRTRQAYGHQVGRFVAWLGNRSPVDGDPLQDEAARYWAVQDTRRRDADRLALSGLPAPVFSQEPSTSAWDEGVIVAGAVVGLALIGLGGGILFIRRKNAAPRSRTSIVLR